MLADSVAQDSTKEATSLPVDARLSVLERRRLAKRHLSSLGLTIATWADRHGYARKTVYKVLSGELHGHYGVTHNIAVRLGLKDGEVQDEHEPPQTPVTAND